jgi:Ca2+-transporting ATPase
LSLGGTTGAGAMAITTTGDGEPACAWHTVAAGDVARRLETDAQAGLTEREAVVRLERYGENAIRERPPRSVLAMFADQFADVMILVLLAAAVVAGVVGEPKDTFVIGVIVVLNAVVGVVQEWRAERALAALKTLTAPVARVIRDGQARPVEAARVVPGDVVLVNAGDVVPSDLRLIEAAALRLDESLLTGESAPVEKATPPLWGASLPVAERSNIAFKGTTVAHGRGRGIVVATGMATEIGRIAQLIDTGARPRTPLQERLAQFGRRLSAALLVLCGIILLFGLARGEPPLLMLLTAVSLAVAAIPEALPAVVTIALALGAREMVRRQALIRVLPAVETLGSVTHICSDKTGTLTQNKMHVEALSVDGDMMPPPRQRGSIEPLNSLLTAMALCSDAEVDQSGAFVGDPTETALSTAARDAGYDRLALEADASRIAELPFDSDRKRMTTVHRHGDGAIAYTKGAPEAVLPLCRTRLAASGEMSLDVGAALAEANAMAEQGLRVIAFAAGRLKAPAAGVSEQQIEADLTFLGFAGLIDPPRPESAESVELCRRAGIVPIMITGDHPATARAIGRRLGIVDDTDPVVTGAELQSMSDEEFGRRVNDIRIYARADPSQKIRIVEALQRNGAFVAMTGDGVNDAPALKRANIGVAMGRGGTDVAKEAASLVLLDDNFATIVGAVREGRRIYDNIRKFIKYTMTSNSGEIWTIFLAPFFGLPIPLLPIHILWINLVTDGLPGLALAAEPEEHDIMRRSPRPPNESVFACGMWQHVVWCGLAMGVVAISSQGWAIASGDAHWQTMVFTILTLSQMGHVLAIRSERDSLLTQGLLTNPPLIGAVLLTFVLQLAVIYVPVFNTVFNTAPLTTGELVLCLTLSSIVFFLVEVEKWLARRGLIYHG